MSTNVVRVSGNYKLKAASGGAISLDAGQTGTVNIIGSLTVSGGTTSITTTNTDIKDNIIFLNKGENGNHITLNRAGIEIDRGTNSDGNAQIFFDETLPWRDPVSKTTKYGLYVFKTAIHGINGIRTNSIDTDGGDLNLINSGIGVLTVSGTSNYEQQVLDYNDFSIVDGGDDIIPNIRAVVDYVNNLSSIGNVNVTQPPNGSTITVADGKILTVNNTLTFTGTDSSSVAFGAGGTVAYASSNLSQFAATTSLQLANVISDETGSGALVFANSPTLITPSLGAAIATTINGLTITSSTGTLTISSGKTITASNTLSFTGIDSSTVEFSNGGTVAYTGNKLNVFATTTSSELAGIISDETGSGSLVFADSPTLITPTLGDAIATTINGLTISSSTGTLSISNGKTLTASNTLTFTGTDSSSVAFSTGGTVAYVANKLNVFAATTSSELAGIISDETGSGSLVFANSPTLITPTLGDATATTINKVTITPPANDATLSIGNTKTLTVSNTLTFTGTDNSTIAFGSGLTISNNKTLTVNNTLTFTGTDSSSVALGAGGTVAYVADKLNVFATTTSSELAGIISDETGTGSLVFATSPTLVTPTLGAATATTINGLTISSSTGTLSISNGKTLTASNTLTFTGTDSSSVAFGAGGTVAYVADKLSAFAATTSAELRGVISDETGTGSLVFATSPTITTSIITNSTSFDLINTTATTVNFAKAATTIGIGDNSGTLTIGNPTVVGTQTTQNLYNTVATTLNIGGVATTVKIGASTGTTTVNNNLTVEGNLVVNGTTTTVNATTLTVTDLNIELGKVDTPTNVTADGGGITLKGTTDKTIIWDNTNSNWTSSEYFNLASGKTYKINNIPVLTSNSVLNDSTQTSITIGGAATSLDIGAATGTTTISNPTVTLSNATTLNINGASPSISTTSTTANVFNSTVTTLNVGGDSTAVNIGASTGTLTISNPTITGTNASTFNMNGSNPSIVTSSTGTASLFNTNALTGNLFGAATTLTIGATSGTMNLRNATITAANATTFNINGADPKIVTSSTGTASLFNTNALTGNLFGAASTINIATDIGTTTINIGAPDSPTHVNIGPSRTGTVSVSGITGASDVVIDSWSLTTYRSAKYLIQVTCTSGTNLDTYQTSEMLVLHDGVTADLVEYAVIKTTNELATFTVDCDTASNGLVRLMAKASNPTDTISVKAYRTILKI